MEEDRSRNNNNNDASKRLANAKKKLQEYKNQKKVEAVNVSSSSVSSPVVNSSITSPVNQEETIISLSGKINGEAQLDSNQSLLESSTSESQNQSSAAESESNEGYTRDAKASGSEIQVSVAAPIVDSPAAVMDAPDFPVANVTVPAPEFVERVVVLEKTESSTQCEVAEDKEKISDVIDALEKDVSILRKENQALSRREAEFVKQLETSEKLIRDLRKEVNQFKEQGNIHQQLEELQSAMVIVSKSKMNIAEELSNEQDKNTELLANLGTYETELQSLRSENSKLWTEINSLKNKLEEEMMKNQVLEDQRRHFSVQVETLQAKINTSEERHSCNDGHDHHQHHHNHETNSHADTDRSHSNCSSNHHHDHNHEHNHYEHNGHDSHDGDHHHGSHEGEHYHHGDHEGEHYHHGDHEEEHHHHGDHERGHDHSHSNSANENDSGDKRKLMEMDKTLKRLEWENKTYEAELMKLAPLKGLEPQCHELRDRNKTLMEEVERLEYLVIQLQSENDTIGDFIQLYQTQKQALRQHAKENDQLVEDLSKEKDELLHKLSELSHAVEKLAAQPHGEVLENQIRDLIDNVNTKVHEPYTCSVCSGSRLMTV